MFSRWAIRPIFRFLLKYLGKFILGDINIEHLVVQLSKLTDLVLDADYLNQKAYESLSEGLGRTASLVGNPIWACQQGAGMGSALVTAVHAAPAAAIAPATAATWAFHFPFLRTRNGCCSCPMFTFEAFSVW